MGKIVLRLDRMMVERKMSLNELAERVGISNVNLSKIKQQSNGYSVCHPRGHMRRARMRSRRYS